MSGELPPNPGFLPLSLAKRVDEACDRFEASWRAKQRPCIENYLAEVSFPERLELFRQLLALEIELRVNDGETPTPEDYSARFLGHVELITSVFQHARRFTEWARMTGKSGNSGAIEPTTLPASAAGAAHAKMLEGPSQTEKETAVPIRLPASFRYELLVEAGRGAMGVVYRACHRILEKYVAIKVLLPGRSRERFLREAKLLATVDSPYVVAVHDFDVLRDGSPILCMDWIDGQTLLEAMRAQGCRVREDVVLPWMRQVCEGMGAAADQGVIHRDLKPSNILIDARGQARVADFGLARGSEPTADLSRTGDVMGTPYYMAPEQAEDPRSVDIRADIYSFGATFYHALTGRPPFEGETTFSVLYKHKAEPPISPRARMPDLSEHVNDILERCLAKSPADRFPSFADVLKHLQPMAAASSPWVISDDKQLTAYLDRYQARRAFVVRLRRAWFVSR
jgi:predicted Ser/Thr protein kinase